MHPPPPPRLLLAYRLFAVRLPEEYRAWAAEDTGGKPFLTWRIVRTSAFCLLLAALFAVGQHAMHEWPGSKWVRVAFAVALAFGLLSSRATLVRKALRWQRVDKHGNPVAPKGLFATLGNAEAGMVVVLGVVLWTCGWAVVGYGLRPSGLTRVPCRAPDLATLAKITDSFQKAGTTIQLSRAVQYSQGVVVSTLVREPGKEGPTFAAFVTQGDSMYELSNKNAPAITKHPRPDNLDPVVGEALQRTVVCLTEGAPR